MPDAAGRNVATSTPEELAAALGKGWAPTFAVVPPCDPDLVLEYVGRWAVALPWCRSAPPSSADYLNFLAHAKDTAPGEDGLPYAAWAAAGQRGAETLFRAGEWQLGGCGLPVEYYAIV